MSVVRSLASTGWTALVPTLQADIHLTMLCGRIPKSGNGSMTWALFILLVAGRLKLRLNGLQHQWLMTFLLLISQLDGITLFFCAELVSLQATLATELRGEPLRRSLACALACGSGHWKGSRRESQPVEARPRRRRAATRRQALWRRLLFGRRRPRDSTSAAAALPHAAWPRAQRGQAAAGLRLGPAHG